MSTENKINNIEHKPSSIVIIGGGISGLAVAWKLCKKGFGVTVIERQKYLGGLGTSIYQNGYNIDIGPHFTSFPNDSKVLQEIKEMMGTENLIELNQIKQAHKTYYRNNLVDKFPNLSHIVYSSGRNFFIKIMIELMFTKFKKSLIKKKPASVRDYLISNYGKSLYNEWFKPCLYEKYVTLEPSIEEVKGLFPPLSFKKMLSSITKKPFTQKKILSSKTSASNYYYREGMGSLIQNMKKKIENDKGKIILGANIHSITHEKTSKKISFTIDDSEQQINADIIIYTVPLPITLQWFDNSSKISNLIPKKNSLFHSIMIFLFVDSPRVYDGWIINIFDADVPFYRISQQSFLSDKVAPPKKSLLCIEIKCTENDDVWDKSDSSLFDSVTKNLRDMGILKNEKINNYKIIKLKNIYPRGESINQNFDSIKDFINSFENEYTLGSIVGDAGELFTPDLINETEETGAGGVYKAFSNADILLEKICSKNVTTSL